MTSSGHVIVTGGSGFIGSHLCDALLARGYHVTAIDNLITGRKKNIETALQSERFTFIEKDICEVLRDSDVPWLKTHGLKGILHFACPASPVDFDRIPLEILAVDSIGTKNMVDLAHLYKARVILASTSEVYGDPLEHPQRETYWGNVNTLGPRSCYDETKRFAEAYLSSARTKLGLDAGIVRIFNTYGPRMRGDDGRVVPELCMQALRGDALTIHGDGSQTRSFCYVTDLVEGIVRMFESKHFGPVNLGNPSERKILDFAQAVLKISGTSLPIQSLPARVDDPKRRCPVIERAQELLGWTPKVDLNEGLKLTFDYFRAEYQS